MGTETSTCQLSQLLWRTSRKLQPRSNWIFCCIVMGDEIWIHHYNPLNQQEAKILEKPDEKTPTPSRITQSAGEIIMIIFWDCEDVLLVDFLPRGATINDPYYASLLHWVHSSILEKRHGKLKRGVLLLHNNASVHKCSITQLLFSTRASPNWIILHIFKILYPTIIICSEIWRSFLVARILRVIMTVNHYL